MNLNTTLNTVIKSQERKTRETEERHLQKKFKTINKTAIRVYLLITTKP